MASKTAGGKDLIRFIEPPDIWNPVNINIVNDAPTIIPFTLLFLLCLLEVKKIKRIIKKKDKTISHIKAHI